MVSISKRTSGSWVSGDYGIMKTATDTLTTPADIYANDTTATVGLKGNMSQTGTPSPDSPITPSECGERTGNLAYGRIDGVNVGSNGTIVRTDVYDVAIGSVESGKVYTINSYVLAFYTDEPTIGSMSYDGSRIVATPGTPTTFTAPITGYVAFRVESGEQAMLNSDSTPLPYEPYGYKIPILSNSTTTNVYLGEVQTTRKIKKLVLDGTETNIRKNDVSSTNYLYYIIVDSGSYNCLCSHLPFYSGTPINVIGINSQPPNRIIYVNFGADIMNSQASGNTIEGLKEYLAAQYAAGTPVTVWYVLATETTGIVNEPIRKIGTYADEVLGITIPTIAGANTISVDTTLQPSEVSVNYKGWHPVQSVHERESGQWD